MAADTSADPVTADAPDYRDTVFLPQTGFPMRAGLPQREPEWLARWERIGIYDRLRERAEGRGKDVECQEPGDRPRRHRPAAATGRQPRQGERGLLRTPRR